jgi:hypothetical protein
MIGGAGMFNPLTLLQRYREPPPPNADETAKRQDEVSTAIQKSLTELHKSAREFEETAKEFLEDKDQFEGKRRAKY